MRKNSWTSSQTQKRQHMSNYKLTEWKADLICSNYWTVIFQNRGSTPEDIARYNFIIFLFLLRGLKSKIQKGHLEVPLMSQLDDIYRKFHDQVVSPWDRMTTLFFSSAKIHMGCAGIGKDVREYVQLFSVRYSLQLCICRNKFGLSINNKTFCFSEKCNHEWDFQRACLMRFLQTALRFLRYYLSVQSQKRVFVTSV